MGASFVSPGVDGCGTKPHGKAEPDLLAATAALVAVGSVSFEEAVLADQIAATLEGCAHLDVVRIGDNVVARTELGRPGRLLLAGHLDTVPPADGNQRPRIDGDTLWGLGAADMKGGLAVMVDLMTTVHEPAWDLTFVCYVAEEVARRHNGLLQIAAAQPALLDADAAILGEPTDARVEAGCQGVVKLAVTVTGERAHTARPWMGRNAIHRLGPVLDRVAAWPGRCPEIDGCTYREALEAVAVSGGVAGNVVPDVATLTLTHRFAPDRDAADAAASIRTWLDPVLEAALGDRIEVVDQSPAAPPGLEHPVLRRLSELADGSPRAKLGWTDVAFFAERGVPAVNFGPGDPELAHRADERVERASLDRARSVLGRLVTECSTS